MVNLDTYIDKRFAVATGLMKLEAVQWRGEVSQVSKTHPRPRIVLFDRN